MAVSRTHGRRIINIELTEGELASIRSMLSDRSITDVYIRTEEYDGVPAALVDRADRVNRADRRRLDAALDSIGHKGGSRFRCRLADAFEVAA